MQKEPSINRTIARTSTRLDGFKYKRWLVEARKIHGLTPAEIRLGNTVTTNDFWARYE